MEDTITKTCKYGHVLTPETTKVRRRNMKRTNQDGTVRHYTITIRECAECNKRRSRDYQQRRYSRDGMKIYWTRELKKLRKKN